jgi:hypothetical protein
MVDDLRCNANYHTHVYIYVHVQVLLLVYTSAWSTESIRSVVTETGWVFIYYLFIYLH